MFKIMVVEDEKSIREELIVLLRNAMYEVAAVTEFNNVVGIFKEEKPDLILLDVNLPETSGLKICMKIRAFSDVPVIFITSCNTSMDELNCINMGGDDYVSKPYNSAVLLARISAVLKRVYGKTNNDSTLIAYKDVELNMATGMLGYNGRAVELTRNELKIMYYLFQNTGKIIPRVEIIEYLWNDQMYIDDNSLSVNITRIRAKLEELGVPDLIKTKRGLGYII
jgi:two-component system, OmpR family, response regulator protein BraR/BceR